MGDVGGMRSVARIIRRRVSRGAGSNSQPTWHLERLSEDEVKSLPAANFGSNEFDCETGMPPSCIIVILTTPRSGSTYLCELLHRSGLCTPHEYFQRELYLPILAERWGCTEDGEVNAARYVSALERHRTSGQGVLGIKIMGSHLRRFVTARPYFSTENVRYLWLQRRDKLRQAVSFAIAKQTGQWSSEYARKAESRYDFPHYSERLKMIHRQEDLVRAFIAATGVECENLYYEDLTADPTGIVRSCFGVDLAGSDRNRTLQKQGAAINDDFVGRLASDLIYGPK